MEATRGLSFPSQSYIRLSQDWGEKVWEDPTQDNCLIGTRPISTYFLFNVLLELGATHCIILEATEPFPSQALKDLTSVLLTCDKASVMHLGFQIYVSFWAELEGPGPFCFVLFFKFKEGIFICVYLT